MGTKTTTKPRAKAAKPRATKSTPKPRPQATPPKRKPRPKRKPAGRKSLIHRTELVDAVVKAVEDGNVLKDAAQSCDLSETAFHTWVRRGEAALDIAREKLTAAVKATANEGDDEGWSNEDLLEAVEERLRPFASFAQRITRAKSKGVVGAQNVLHELMGLVTSGDHRQQRIALEATKFFLERRRPEDYGRADRLELSGNDAKPVGIKIFLPELEGES